jgi:hypothetical protein
MVKFPTKTSKTWGAVIDIIDNIFTDCTRFKKVDIRHIINGSSDNDTQLQTIYKNNIKSFSKTIHKQQIINYTSITSIYIT